MAMECPELKQAGPGQPELCSKPSASLPAHPWCTWGRAVCPSCAAVGGGGGKRGRAGVALQALCDELLEKEPLGNGPALISAPPFPSLELGLTDLTQFWMFCLL